MTRLSDEAWRAKMEGKPIVGKDHLPLFDQPKPTAPRPITSEEIKAHAKAIGSAAAINHPPYTREDGCERPKLPNDEASDPWARARAGKAPTPVERGTAGSEAAGSKWTKAEKQAIDSAIGILAAAEIPFTSDEVWALAPGVPVSKGIGARLRLAARRGLIRNTGEHRTSTRGGKHDHAQTLTIWIGGRP